MATGMLENNSSFGDDHPNFELIESDYKPSQKTPQKLHEDMEMLEQILTSQHEEVSPIKEEHVKEIIMQSDDVGLNR